MDDHDIVRESKLSAKEQLTITHRLQERLHDILDYRVRVSDEKLSDLELVLKVYSRFMRDMDVEPGDPSR